MLQATTVACSTAFGPARCRNRRFSGLSLSSLAPRCREGGDQGGAAELGGRTAGNPSPGRRRAGMRCSDWKRWPEPIRGQRSRSWVQRPTPHPCPSPYRRGVPSRFWRPCGDRARTYPLPPNLPYAPPHLIPEGQPSGGMSFGGVRCGACGRGLRLAPGRLREPPWGQYDPCARSSLDEAAAPAAATARGRDNPLRGTGIREPRGSARHRLRRSAARGP